MCSASGARRGREEGASQRPVPAVEKAAAGPLEESGLPDVSPAGRRGVASTSVSARLEWGLFCAALLLYAVTRVVGLTRFPIFFFCDEAIQANLAEQLLQNGFRDHTGTFLPPYFLNDQRWAVSLSVYVHLLPTWLFGKSVLVVRATSVAVTVLGAIALGIALKTIGNRLWWSAPLVLGAMPVFFLHARTAFESTMMASFYACFLCAYLLYRYRSPRYLFAALLFGAATFYAYTAGQGVMLVIGVVLLFSVLRYHLRQRKALLVGAAVLALVLAAPYLRYRKLHPGVVREQLAVLNSYWLELIPLSEKLEHFGRNYVAGLDPRYWFQPNEVDVVRHRMKGMGYFPLVYLPIVAVGAGVCLRRFRRSSAHRAILFSPLGVPFAGAAADIQILRLLGMVVPAALLMGIGLDTLFGWLRRVIPAVPLALACAGAFAIGITRMTATALVEGPTWYNDYELYGMQYGAPQVFRAIKDELTRTETKRVLLSPSWANNPNEFVWFFLGPQERSRVVMLTIHTFLLSKQPVSTTDLFVMTPEEYKLARTSRQLALQPPARIVPRPDGSPGFYFVRVRYAEDADAVFAREREARKRLIEASVIVDGQALTVRHSPLDMGRLVDLFDGRGDTLIRGAEANPFVLELAFPSPRLIGKVTLALGAMDRIGLRIVVTPAEGGKARAFESSQTNRPPRPRLELALPGGPVLASRMRLEITEVGGGEITHVHVYELSLDPPVETKDLGTPRKTALSSGILSPPCRPTSDRRPPCPA